MGQRLPPLKLLNSADGWSPAFERQFNRFYDGILARAIPDPDLRESRGRLKRLSDPRGFGQAEPWGFLTLALAAHARGWRPAGGICYEWYRGGGAALVTYVIVAPEIRHRGLAQLLLANAFQQLRRASHLQPGTALPVFAETETVGPDSSNLEKREAAVRFPALSGLGFRALDFPYVQPPLSAGRAHVEHLTLLAYAPSGSSRTYEAARIERFLSVFYRALIGDAVDTDAPCRRVLDHLQMVKSVALQPLFSDKSIQQRLGDGADERRSPLA